MNNWERESAFRNIGWSLGLIKSYAQERRSDYVRRARECHSDLSYVDFHRALSQDERTEYYESAMESAAKDVREHRRRFHLWRKYGDHGSKVMAAVNLLRQANRAGLLSSRPKLEIADEQLWRETVAPDVYLNRMERRLRKTGWWPVYDNWKDQLFVPTHLHALFNSNVRIIGCDAADTGEWRHTWPELLLRPIVEVPSLTPTTGYDGVYQPYKIWRDVEHFALAVIDDSVGCNLGIALAQRMTGSRQRIFITSFFETGFTWAIPF